MRIDKYLSENTDYSRSEINNLIKKAKVSLNDVVIYKKETKINPDSDVIKISGNLVENKSNLLLAFNKGQNTICSNVREQDGVYIVNDFVPIQGLHIIGRLDKNTEGLLLMTNNGHYTQLIKSPKANIEKEYYVILKEELSNEDLDYLNTNTFQMDGKTLKPFVITRISDKEFLIIIQEGKYHQVKRIFNFVKNEVVFLKRIRIGKLKLETLNLKTNEFKKIDLKDVL